MDGEPLFNSGHTEKEELQWKMGKEVQRKSGSLVNLENKKREQLGQRKKDD